MVLKFLIDTFGTGVVLIVASTILTLLIVVPVIIIESKIRKGK